MQTYEIEPPQIIDAGYLEQRCNCAARNAAKAAFDLFRDWRRAAVPDDVDTLRNFAGEIRVGLERLA
jgi:hypothetical protein